MPNETQYIPEGTTTINSLTGAVTLAAGSNITITPSGNTLTIASSGGGGGNGFAAGATVAGSTGNTPAKGFTLSDGSGDTIVADPTVPSIIITNAGGFTGEYNAGGIALADGVGDGISFSSADPSLNLVAASGTKISNDGSVPSTTWDDGAGNTTLVVANAALMTNAAGDTNSIGPNQVVVTASTGESVNFSATTGESQLTLNDPSGNGLALVAGAVGAVSAGQFGLGSIHQTTVGTLGAASALPALPSGYWLINVEGTSFVIPYYKAS